MAEDVFVGIDVSKHSLDVAVRPNDDFWSVKNSAKGITTLVARLSQLKPTLVVLESTGGYEKQAVKALVAARIPVAVANPRRVRDFARSTGQLAKTDKLDAQVLAKFADRVRPNPVHLSTEAEERLQGLLRRRQQLLDMRVAERNRLESIHPDLAEQVQRHIEWLEEEIRRLEEQMEELIEQESSLKQKAEIIRSVPGVGPVMTYTLLSEMPELGLLDRKQIAALAGVAPLNRDSGKRSRKRHIRGGRPVVRHVLYMATLSAIQHNPVIQRVYHRLKEAGKERLVAVVACMRKLLVILNAMVRSMQPWQPQLPLSQD